MILGAIVAATPALRGTLALGADLIAPVTGESPTSIFSRLSTPAADVHQLSIFVLLITCGIFLGMSAVLTYALLRFRAKPGDDSEPPQVFGSIQIELAWTIIPILLIAVLFLGTARILFAVQDAPKPATALDVTVIGHQYWWEFRYPKYNVVTANELHVPLVDEQHNTPTFIKLTSADVIHSFWIPQLAGKTDVLPNRVNEMWIDPRRAGVYEGQCAQFCGTQHAKMLLRVYVDTPEQFAAWVANQQKQQESGTTMPQEAEAQSPNQGDQPAAATNGPSASDSSASPQGSHAGTPPPNSASTYGEISAQNDAWAVTPQNGRRVFEQEACMNCHNVSGTVANGRYGPDLTHLMSRQTIASGAVENTPGNLEKWVADPNTFKPGCLMPAMHLTDRQNAQITAYLLTLK